MCVKWFRMYNDARTDEKLKSLTDAQFRVWFRMMCFASEQSERGVIPIRSHRLLAVEVAGGDVELLASTLDELSQLEIVSVDDSTVTFIHWNQRQFDSDGSTERWRKWKNQRPTNVGQTLGKRLSNGEPTRLYTDIDKERDKDQKIASANASDSVGEFGGAQSSETGKGENEAPAEKPSEYTADFEKFWDVYPRRTEKKAAYKAWQAQIRKGTKADMLVTAAVNYAESCKARGTLVEYIKHAKTFLGPSSPFEDYTQTLKVELNVSAHTEKKHEPTKTADDLAVEEWLDNAYQ